jgi:hypothetical protein
MPGCVHSSGKQVRRQGITPFRPRAEKMYDRLHLAARLVPRLRTSPQPPSFRQPRELPRRSVTILIPLPPHWTASPTSSLPCPRRRISRAK